MPPFIYSVRVTREQFETAAADEVVFGTWSGVVLGIALGPEVERPERRLDDPRTRYRRFVDCDLNVYRSWAAVRRNEPEYLLADPGIVDLYC